ncbi:MAG: hypothetical protein KIT17_05545 [Rubrivivax sp.]|nr:hypothetical protein [Rubrivivax sp.]
MEAISRLAGALVGGLKRAVDFARVAVGLPPAGVSMADCIGLAAAHQGFADGRDASREAAVDLRTPLAGSGSVDDLASDIGLQHSTRSIGVVGNELMIRSDEFHSY